MSAAEREHFAKFSIQKITNRHHYSRPNGRPLPQQTQNGNFPPAKWKLSNVWGYGFCFYFDYDAKYNNNNHFHHHHHIHDQHSSSIIIWTMLNNMVRKTSLRNCDCYCCSVVCCLSGARVTHRTLCSWFARRVFQWLTIRMVMMLCGPWIRLNSTIRVSVTIDAKVYLHPANIKYPSFELMRKFNDLDRKILLFAHSNSRLTHTHTPTHPHWVSYAFAHNQNSHQTGGLKK